MARKIVKGGTASKRKHRFESFNQRIAKLSVDPVRRPRQHEIDEDDLSISQSFLKASLDRWRELNLSENFTFFIKEVDPICNNLAQIIHYNQHIFEILTRYISMRDALSLEPLLDLLSQFAHDLGVKFEVHFSSAVTLVASIASQHADIEVIEWGFTNLSWLFKFLSRLLVPNLRPVFEIMAPFLGREPQKPHTIRFAAEAMSFLIRKAAAVHKKNTKPLNTIVDAIRDDVIEFSKLDPGASRVELYQRGLMTLLVESMRGIERRLHSGSASIFHCLIDRFLLQDYDLPNYSHDIIYGVIVALIHHSDGVSFEPLAEIVSERVQDIQLPASSEAVAVCGRLLFIISTVRKGTRVQNWTPLLSAISHLMKLDGKLDPLAQGNVCKAAAVIFQSSPLDLLLPYFRSAMAILTSPHYAYQFLPFCNYFADLGRQRFSDLLLPYFMKFFVAKWTQNELELCVVTPRLIDEDAREKPACPRAWQSKVMSLFHEVKHNGENAARCNSFLNLLDHVYIDSDVADQILEDLLALLDQQIEGPPLHSPTALLTFGNGLKSLTLRAQKQSLVSRWSKLCLQARHFGNMPPFLESMLLLAKNETLPCDTVNELIDVLADNAHSDSHKLRQFSLQIVDTLYASQQGEHAEIITAALSIEESPLSLQSARSITMLSRTMASLYGSASSHPWLCKVIPHYCFGMLTFQLSQARDDAITALKEICQTKVGEEIVASILFDYLEAGLSASITCKSGKTEQTQHGQIMEFQCSNLVQIEDIIQRDTEEVRAADQYCRKTFDVDHEMFATRNDNFPTLALRVLMELPHVAEKRSRQIVPYFLSWASAERQRVSEDPSEIAEVLPVPETGTALCKLRKQDRKATLDLFSKFTNPKVLFRASEVYNALQDLLSNGNVEIQRSALKAMFTWKSTGLLPYQENLFNLMDESRFREEISTFVQINDEVTIVQEEHRPELMPVMLRLLYGKTIAGTGSGSKGQAVKRKAVLQALSRMDAVYLLDFIYIAIGSLRDANPIEGEGTAEACLALDLVSARKQVGLVTMIKDMLEVLGDRLAPFSQILGNAIMYCLIQAARSLQLQENSSAEQSVTANSQLSLCRVVRQTGLQCLNLLFRSCPASSLHCYVPVVFREVLGPRIEQLPIETAQSVSGTLRLLSTWASSKDNILNLVSHNDRTVKMIISCLEVPSAKDEVKIFVLDDILQNLVDKSQRPGLEDQVIQKKKAFVIQVEHPNEDLLPPGREYSNEQQTELIATVDSDVIEDRGSKTIFEKVLKPNIHDILVSTENLLQENPSKDLLTSTIRIISALAPMVEESPHIRRLLIICISLLDQRSNRVSPRSKGELLQVLQHFIPLTEIPPRSELFEKLHRTTSSMFTYFKDRQNRLALSQVLSILADKDTELRLTAQLCSSLNAYSTTKVDEPDFDERQSAYDVINEEHYKNFTLKQWRPIVHNVLYYIRDEEDSFRLKASRSLQRFVEMNPIDEAGPSKEEANKLIEKVLLPAIRAGVSHPSEMVRTEYLTGMAHLVRRNRDWEDVADMFDLLVDDDEEASFFANILHIQQHRRLRALRRLATEARDKRFNCANVAEFFIPLLEHFIFDKVDDEVQHNLRSESVVTIGALASWLEWSKFRAIFQRYSRYIQSKPEDQKIVIKLLGALIDSLTRAVELRNGVRSDYEIEMELDEQQRSVLLSNSLADTVPRSEIFTRSLIKDLLPTLEKYLHDKDESTVSLRIPVAVSVVKLLKILPSRQMKERLPPVLTDVCHILRSRTQESRDLTRKTLVEISALIGPVYFGFILRELRSSLARGYQLHVLSYTVHSILVATVSIYKPGDLDYCLPQIVAVVLDDILGSTGQEKDAEEYINKMKEVKSSKSFDSMELVAKTTSIEHIAHLIRPLQVLLEEKLNLKMMRKIDELLRRIGAGLLRNDAIQDQRALKFCHEIISEVYKREQSCVGSLQEDHRAKRILIQYKGADKGGARGATSSHSYKLVRLALDILRSVLQKYNSLQTPENLAAFIPIIGDAILQTNEEIKISALRLLASIIKVPLKSIHENCSIYIAECVKIIKASNSINVNLAHAALKLVSAMLRESAVFEIKETHLAYLLQRLIPDLDEPDKQGVAFNFLKAVMTRKIMNPEIYEVMDTVAKIMVTNDTKGARDMARGAYIQFFMDYPQSKRRFAEQLSFLSLNLRNYGNEQGRKSVMETAHLLLHKVGENLVQEIAKSFFLPLALALVNDESNSCREMAGALLRKVFELADIERTKSFLGLLRAWLNQTKETLLVRLSLEVYILHLDVHSTQSEQEIPALYKRTSQILKNGLKSLTAPECEVLYFALEALAKMTQLFPAIAFASPTVNTWTSVRGCLLFPHPSVKLSSARLLGTYFADFARSNLSLDDVTLPLQGSHGLLLDESDIVEITRSSISLLRSTSVNEKVSGGLASELAGQVVRNLVFNGRMMAQTSMIWPHANQESAAHDNLTDGETDEGDGSEGGGDASEGFDNEKTTNPALGHVILSASRILRRGTISTHAQSLIPLRGSLSLLDALTKAVPLPALMPHVPNILLPLHNLTDPSISHPFSIDESFTEGYKNLVENARLLKELLEKKLGTTQYTNLMSTVREGVKARREGRRVKRRIESVVAPERAGQLKKRKFEKKREQRKRKSHDQQRLRRGW